MADISEKQVATQSPATATQFGRFTRPAYLALGWICVGAGIIGIVLPVMPTTIFLLMAIWAFSRSSPRFSAWVRAHPLLGRYVRDWEAYGAIPTRAKILALAMMSASLVWLVWFSAAPPAICALVAAIMAGAAAYILSRPAPP